MQNKTKTILLSILFRYGIFHYGESAWYSLYLNTLSRIDVLVIGAIGALWYHRKPIHFRLRRSIRFFCWTILLISLFTVKVYAWNDGFLAGFKKYFFLCLIAVLLLDYNFNPQFRHLLKPGSIFHYFGKISYGIYMYGNIIFQERK